MTPLDLLRLDSPGWGGVLLEGALTTLEIAVSAFLLGLVLGFGGALAKLSPVRPLVVTATIYSTVMRAVPELLLIILLYYAGTDALNRLFLALGIEGEADVSGFAAAIGVLGLVLGAYATEVIRGAILSIPIGQIEAARAYGMGPALVLRRVVLPAMLPAALPGLANLWMILIKDTALISVVGATELLSSAKQAAGTTKHYFLFYCAAAAIYFVITVVSNRVFRAIEARVRVAVPAR